LTAKIDQTRQSEWIDAETVSQLQMNQVSECLVQIGDDLPRRRSRDSGSTVHHPRGRRNDQLQSELGKRLCWVVRYATLSWPWRLGTDVVSSARLKDEALSCGCYDDYGTVQENDGFGFGVGDAAGHDRRRRR